MDAWPGSVGQYIYMYVSIPLFLCLSIYQPRPSFYIYMNVYIYLYLYQLRPYLQEVEHIYMEIWPGSIYTSISIDLYTDFSI